MANKLKVVSLFAGCGGVDLGFLGGFNHCGTEYAEQPFEVIWANDFNKDACGTYTENIGGHIRQGDIWDILANPESFGMPDSCDVVTGGFPCQPFSTAGLRKGTSDPRGTLYLAMREVIQRLQPKVFVAENVKGILSIDGGNTINQIVADFASLGYDVQYKLLHSADYGIAQNRERVLIVGVKQGLGLSFQYPATTTAGTRPGTATVLADLEHLAEGQAPNHYWSKGKKNAGRQGNNAVPKDAPSPTMRAEHHGNIEFHYNGLRRLSAREAARIQTFPDNFVFGPSTSAAYKQIGNAVPPVLGWHMAKAVAETLTPKI